MPHKKVSSILTTKLAQITNIKIYIHDLVRDTQGCCQGFCFKKGIFSDFDMAKYLRKLIIYFL